MFTLEESELLRRMIHFGLAGLGLAAFAAACFLLI